MAESWEPPDKGGQASRAVELLKPFLEHLGVTDVEIRLGREEWKRLRNEFKRPYRPEPTGGFVVYVPRLPMPSLTYAGQTSPAAAAGVAMAVTFKCAEPEP